MVDFSAVSLKIQAPNAPEVLNVLAQIDERGQRSARATGRIGQNVTRSVTAARTLSYAMTGVSSGISGAAGAAGMLAEQIALSTRNAKIAAGGLAIGALVAIGVQLASVYKTATKQMDTFNDQISKVGGEIAILQKQGIGGPANELAIKKEQILQTTQRELAAARELKVNDDERKAILEQIYQKGRAAAAAAEREAALARAARQRELAAAQFDMRSETGGIFAGLRGAPGSVTRTEAAERQRIAAEHQRRLNDLRDRQADPNTRLSFAAWTAARQDIEDRLDADNKALRDKVAAMGADLGHAFIGSIADGISTAVGARSLGDGFKAMTAGILSGLGDMAITVGEKSLAIASLMSAIRKALEAFAPVGAIGAALALIGLGVALKGTAAALGRGRSAGAGGGGYGGGYYGGGGGATVIDRGLINPLNAGPTPGSVPLRSSSVINVTLIGKDDPRAQRELLEMIDRAESRRS